mmetsp:Transcript_20379/g.44556  ORF Transcript_20379/g.44556 Transcript_20379/m.44556 type:complete len:82 (+) Transcript_20379:1234-1479(+)
MTCSDDLLLARSTAPEPWFLQHAASIAHAEAPTCCSSHMLHLLHSFRGEESILHGEEQTLHGEKLILRGEQLTRYMVKSSS